MGCPMGGCEMEVLGIHIETISSSVSQQFHEVFRRSLCLFSAISQPLDLPGSRVLVDGHHMTLADPLLGMVGQGVVVLVRLLDLCWLSSHEGTNSPCFHN